MKFNVTYEKPKKKGFSKQTAVFYNVEDAYQWERYIREHHSAKNIQILPNFN
jgi:hypothetical protein